MNATAQKSKKRKANEESDRITARTPATISPPRRFLSYVSGVFKRSPNSTCSQKASNTLTPAINHAIEGITNASMAGSNVKASNLTYGSSNDVYYQFGSSSQSQGITLGNTKLYQPSPPPPNKPANDSLVTQLDNSMVPYNDSHASAVVAGSNGSNKMFSSIRSKPFSIGHLPLANRAIPSYRRKPLKLADPGRIFRLLNKLEEDCPALRPKANEPVAVKRMRISEYRDPRWVIPARKEDKDMPKDVSLNARVEVKYHMAFDCVAAITEMDDFMEARISNHNKTAKTSPSSTPKKAHIRHVVTAQPASGWGDNMFLAKGAWKCDKCLVQNKKEVTICASCEVPRDGTDAQAASTSSATEGKIGNTGFSFGASASKTSPSNGGGAISNTGFSFGVSSTEKGRKSSDASDDTKKTNGGGAISNTGFSFGAATTEKKRKSDDAKDEPKSLFSFGASASTSTSFGASTATATATATAKPTGGFAFPGKPTDKSTDAEPKTPLFNFGSAAPTAPPTNPSISLYKPSPTNEPKAFSFGATPKTTDDANPEVAFAFGSSDAGKKEVKAESASFVATPSAKRKKDDPATPFPFGGKTSPAPTAPTAPTPVFLFGGKPKPFPTAPTSLTSALKTSKPDTPALFGTATAVKKTNFSFGAAQAVNETIPETTAPSTSGASFTFGAGTADPKKEPSATQTPAFAFGGPPQPPSATPAATPFAFGAVKDSTTPAPPFEFGTSSVTSNDAPAPTTQFGTAASSQPFSSGNTSFPPQQQPFTSSSAPAFNALPFGGLSNTASSFGGTASAAPFGASTTATPTSFGASATNASSTVSSFGTAPPSSTPFQPNTSNFAGGNTQLNTGYTAAAPTSFPTQNQPSFPSQQQVPQAFNFGGPPAANAGFTPAASFSAGNAAPSFNAGGAQPGGFNIGAGGAKKTGVEKKRRLIRARRPPSNNA